MSKPSAAVDLYNSLLVASVPKQPLDSISTYHDGGHFHISHAVVAPLM